MPIKYQLLISRGQVVIKLLTVVSLSAGLGCTSSSSPTDYGNGGSPAFSPKDVQINVGDTVKWVGVSGTNTVTSGTGAGDPNAGTLFDQPLAAGQSFSRAFTAAGVVPYFCRPHEAMGMKGTVTVSAVVAQIVQVSASGVSFSPANVSIHVGDAVKWSSSGAHTVTSGPGSSDPNAGSLFDKTLSAGQTFQHAFTSPGTYHYFCRPHEGAGMKGTITVTEVKPQSVQVNATS